MSLGWSASCAPQPNEFSVNNDRDEPGSGGNADKDVQPVPNELNTHDFCHGHIRCQRNLEDFAHLWISGLPELPAGHGYKVTLRMDASSGNPAINLYWSAESGGIGYLTNADTAALQVLDIGGTGYGVSIGTVSNNHSYTFPDEHVLWWIIGDNALTNKVLRSN